MATTMLKCRNKTLLFLSFCFVVIVTSLCVLNLTVGAKSVVNSKKGLTVSPLRNELEIAPGFSYEGQLAITNSTTQNMTVNLSALTFSVINQQYDYAFTSESDVAKWVNFEQSSVVLQPSENKIIKFNINVPLSAEPGGRYISLFATNDIETADGDISSRQRVGSLVYLTVAGKVSRSGSLLSINSPWLITGDSSWSAAVRNSGSTHFRSRYRIVIKSVINQSTVAEQSGDALILPGTIRLVGDKLPLPKLPGLYRIVFNIGLGDTPAKTESKFVIFLPVWTLLVLAFVAGAILFVVCRKKLRKKLI